MASERSGNSCLAWNFRIINNLLLLFTTIKSIIKVVPVATICNHLLITSMNYFFQRIIKRQARVYFFLFLLLVFLSESSQQCYLFGNSINNSVPRLDSNRSVDVYRTRMPEMITSLLSVN